MAECLSSKRTTEKTSAVLPQDAGPDKPETGESTSAGHGRHSVGHAPLEATVFEMERLRCNACGEVFTAEEPEAAGLAKYDETAVAMIALLKYGTGMPFKRLERLQAQLGMPLPAATQWELMADAANYSGWHWRS
jgi:hypothetical protein